MGGEGRNLQGSCKPPLKEGRVATAHTGTIRRIYGTVWTHNYSRTIFFILQRHYCCFWT